MIDRSGLQCPALTRLVKGLFSRQPSRKRESSTEASQDAKLAQSREVFVSGPGKEITLHATIRSYASDGGLVDALLAKKDEVRDLLSGIDGFRAYYILRTPDGGAASISVYDDAAGTDASNAAAAEWVRDNLPSLAAAPPQTTAGEVAVSF